MPTLAGFLLFIRNVMGITTVVLPDDSMIIGIALNAALTTVNTQLCAVPNIVAAGVAPGNTLYAWAVYNFGGSVIINYAQDLPDADIVPGSGKPGLPFFEFARQRWNTNGFTSGVVQSTSDNGTSVSMLVPEQLKELKLADLQQLKDPYGRAYLAIAQKAGDLWGLS